MASPNKNRDKTSKPGRAKTTLQLFRARKPSLPKPEPGRPRQGARAPPGAAAPWLRRFGPSFGEAVCYLPKLMKPTLDGQFGAYGRFSLDGLGVFST